MHHRDGEERVEAGRETHVQGDRLNHTIFAREESQAMVCDRTLR
jgi:hypothetical protein